jgi:hypothetical protein
MTKMGLRRIVLLFAVTLLLMSGCNGLGGKGKAVPVEKALEEYFKGGYVPYSLPGRGDIFEPGAIIRYRKGAEVLVRQRAECFALATSDREQDPPKFQGESSTQIQGALGLVLPKAAATELSSELQQSKVQSVKIDFGTLVAKQIPEGSVGDQQKKLDFPQKCKDEYGENKILVLGTIGSKTILYQFAGSSEFEAGLKAASELNVGGGVTVKRSENFKNTMEVVSDDIIWLGYIPYELKKEGLAGKGEIGAEEKLVIKKLPVDQAIEMKRESERAQ